MKRSPASLVVIGTATAPSVAIAVPVLYGAPAPSSRRLHGRRLDRRHRDVNPRPHSDDRRLS